MLYMFKTVEFFEIVYVYKKENSSMNKKNIKKTDIFTIFEKVRFFTRKYMFDPTKKRIYIYFFRFVFLKSKSIVIFIHVMKKRDKKNKSCNTTRRFTLTKYVVSLKSCSYIWILSFKTCLGRRKLFPKKSGIFGGGI